MKNLKKNVGALYEAEIDVILEILRTELQIDGGEDGHFYLGGGAKDEAIQSIIQFDIGGGRQELPKFYDGNFVDAPVNFGGNPETLCLQTTHGRFVISYSGSHDADKILFTVGGSLVQMCVMDFDLAASYKTSLFFACEKNFELKKVYDRIKDLFSKSGLPSIKAWKSQWADPNEDKLYFEK